MGILHSLFCLASPRRPPAISHPYPLGAPHHHAASAGAASPAPLSPSSLRHPALLPRDTPSPRAHSPRGHGRSHTRDPSGSTAASAPSRLDTHRKGGASHLGPSQSRARSSKGYEPLDRVSTPPRAHPVDRSHKLRKVRLVEGDWDLVRMEDAAGFRPLRIELDDSGLEGLFAEPARGAGEARAFTRGHGRERDKSEDTAVDEVRGRKDSEVALLHA